MSMSIVVGKLKVISQKKMDADFQELSKAIVITPYMDEIISEYVEELPLYEKVGDKYEMVKYRTITHENLLKLTEKLDGLTDSLFDNFKNTQGKNEKQEIVNRLKNLTDLNYIIRQTYIFYFTTKVKHFNVRLLIG